MEIWTAIANSIQPMHFYRAIHLQFDTCLVKKKSEYFYQIQVQSESFHHPLPSFV